MHLSSYGERRLQGMDMKGETGMKVSASIDSLDSRNPHHENATPVSIHQSREVFKEKTYNSHVNVAMNLPRKLFVDDCVHLFLWTLLL